MKIKFLYYIFLSFFFVGCAQKTLNLSSLETKLDEAKTSYNESYSDAASLIGSFAKEVPKAGLEDDIFWPSIKAADNTDRVKQSRDAYQSIIDAEEEFDQLYINNKNIPESFKTNLYELKAIIENNALFIGMMAKGEGSWRAAKEWKSQSEKTENIFKSLRLEIERLKK